jgi:hypothetical protein
MPTYTMRFPSFDARSNRGEIRWELFIHRDVRDVLVTPCDDTLLVVFRGQPDVKSWTETLIEAGFPRPRFDGTGGDEIMSNPRDAAA